MFCGDTIYNDIELKDNVYTFDNVCEVNTINGWKYSVDLTINDILINDDNEQVIIKNIIKENNQINVYI